MATTYPITTEELQSIPGVGEGKAKRYGDDFLKVIKAYVEEKEIERPEDLRVRSVANKSKRKIAIIQAIDRKIDLEEVAVSTGLDFDQLLDEIESIVNSGNKINISYFLDEKLDEDEYKKFSTISATPNRARSMRLTANCAPTTPRRKFALCE